MWGWMNGKIKVSMKGRERERDRDRDRQRPNHSNFRIFLVEHLFIENLNDKAI